MRKRLRIMRGLHLARAAILARVAGLGKNVVPSFGFSLCGGERGSWTQLVQGFRENRLRSWLAQISVSIRGVHNFRKTWLGLGKPSPPSRPHDARDFCSTASLVKFTNTVDFSKLIRSIWLMGICTSLSESRWPVLTTNWPISQLWSSIMKSQTWPRVPSAAWRL